MIIDVRFEELSQDFALDFGEVVTASDGGFERGYEAGYVKGEEAGEAAGYVKGHSDGLAQRTYETWTLTMADGSVIEKEVALL